MDFNNENNVNEQVEETPVVEVAPVETVEGEVVVEATETPAKKKSGLEIGALVCGIISILSCACCGLGLVLGIVALVLAIMSKKKNAEGKFSGMALAGLICGIVGILCGGTYLLLYGVGFAAGLSEMQYYM